MTHDRSGTPRSRAPSATSASRLTTPSMIAAVLGTEDRGFAFFHLQAILTERVDNVRLVRDNNCVCTGLWCYAEHLGYASARRLFSFGDTTRLPSVRSAVFSISVNSASTTVSYVLGSTAVVRDRRIVEGVDG